MLFFRQTSISIEPGVQVEVTIEDDNVAAPAAAAAAAPATTASS